MALHLAVSVIGPSHFTVLVRLPCFTTMLSHFELAAGAVTAGVEAVVDGVEFAARRTLHGALGAAKAAAAEAAAMREMTVMRRVFMAGFIWVFREIFSRTEGRMRISQSPLPR